MEKAAEKWRIVVKWIKLQNKKKCGTTEKAARY
jgi:hypothetical protein